MPLRQIVAEMLRICCRSEPPFFIFISRQSNDKICQLESQLFRVTFLWGALVERCAARQLESQLSLHESLASSLVTCIVSHMCFWFLANRIHARHGTWPSKNAKRTNTREVIRPLLNHKLRNKITIGVRPGRWSPSGGSVTELCRVMLN